MMSSCFYNGTHKYDLSVKTEAKVDQPEDTSFPAYAIAIIVVVVLILLLLAVVAVVVLCAICYRRKRFLDSFKVLRVIISLCYAHVHSLPLLPTFLSLSLLSLPLPSYTPIYIYTCQLVTTKMAGFCMIHSHRRAQNMMPFSCTPKVLDELLRTVTLFRTLYLWRMNGKYLLLS